MSKKKKFVVIDGHHLIFRAYYAMSNMKKWAIFWFASMLLNIIEIENPDYLAVTFDLYKSFRHDKDPEYKAQRKQTPDDLKEQMPKIYEMVEKMWIPIYAVDWYEADDVMWAISKINLEYEDIKTIIVTWDMDILQLVKNWKTTIAIPHKWYKEAVYFDEEAVFEKYWLTPKQIICFKAIAWDTSDNIKWIPWIWAIWATKLIKKFWSAKKIFEELKKILESEKKAEEKFKISWEKSDKKNIIKCDFIKWAIKTKLQNWINKIDDLVEMTTICTDFSLENFSLENTKFSWIKSEWINFLKNEEFHSLIRRLDKMESDKRLEDQLMLF